MDGLITSFTLSKPSSIVLCNRLNASSSNLVGAKFSLSKVSLILVYIPSPYKFARKILKLLEKDTSSVSKVSNNRMMFL